MLDKRLPKIYSHIYSLKDVKDLSITVSKQNGENKIICPISMIEFSGLNSFYFFWNCGCLISKMAFDELKMKDQCILCAEKFDKEKDLVNLNYTKEERAQIFQALLLDKIKTKKMKIEKKIIKKEKNIKQENLDSRDYDLFKEFNHKNIVNGNNENDIKNINKDHAIDFNDGKIEKDYLKEKKENKLISYINKKRKRS